MATSRSMPGAVRAQFAEMTQRIREATGNRRTPAQVAEGVGHRGGEHGQRDQADLGAARSRRDQYTLCCFWRGPACVPGGGRPGHDPDIHPSACRRPVSLWHGLADITAIASRQWKRRWSRATGPAGGHAGATRQRRAKAQRQDVPQERVRLVRRMHLRYDGTDSALIVGFSPIADMVRQFEAAYRQRYAFLMPNRALMAEAVSVKRSASPMRPSKSRRRAASPVARRKRRTRRHAHRRHIIAPVPAAAPCSRRQNEGPGDHRRGQRDHRGRTGWQAE